MMKEFCCPSCDKKSFKIVPYRIRQSAQKVLMIVCDSCTKPLGLVQSLEAAALMKEAAFVRFNEN